MVKCKATIPIGIPKSPSSSTSLPLLVADLCSAYESHVNTRRSTSQHDSPADDTFQRPKVEEASHSNEIRETSDSRSRQNIRSPQPIVLTREPIHRQKCV